MPIFLRRCFGAIIRGGGVVWCESDTAECGSDSVVQSCTGGVVLCDPVDVLWVDRGGVVKWRREVVLKGRSGVVRW